MNNQNEIKNIVLIGFMGTGKSTIAKALSNLYGMKIAEMDQLIEEREEMSIPDIFAQKGDAYFRTVETNLILELQQHKNMIISSGGGAPLREENVKAMKQNGIVYLLNASAETIFARVGQDLHRPVLNGRRSVEGISELLDQRMPKYRAAADYVISIENKTAAEIAKEIMRQHRSTHS